MPRKSLPELFRKYRLSRQERKEKKAAYKEIEFGKTEKTLTVDRLTDAHIEEFQKAFKTFDKDGDGSISIKELGVLLRSLGLNPTEREIRSMCIEADLNDDGRLCFMEFLFLITDHFDSIDIEAELKTAFQVFDDRGKGFIDVNELKYCLMNIGDPLSHHEVEELLEGTDEDVDGKINYHEFVTMMTKESLSALNEPAAE